MLTRRLLARRANSRLDASHHGIAEPKPKRKPNWISGTHQRLTAPTSPNNYIYATTVNFTPLVLRFATTGRRRPAGSTPASGTREQAIALSRQRAPQRICSSIRSLRPVSFVIMQTSMSEPFIKLSCAHCGTTLDVYDDMERFSCAATGEPSWPCSMFRRILSSPSRQPRSNSRLKVLVSAG
jgi:hypothetical protein